MKKNMAVADRLLRFVLAIVLMVLAFLNDYSMPVNTVLLTVALVFIVTAYAGVCPLYSLLRIDTRQFKH